MDVEEQRLRGRFRSALLAVVASLAVPSAWAAGPKASFNIPAGDFSQAILDFAKQSHVDVFYASLGSVAGIRTQGVVGELDVQQAMARMLEGTGFTFEVEDTGALLVKRETERAQPHVAKAIESSSEESREDSAPEVVVTGSYIHGLNDIVSPLVIVGNRAKKRASYGTVQDVLQTLPFNFGGGPSEDFSPGPNLNRGSSVNLRGLGAGATLVLVNGRRRPVSGIEGDFVDVSTIPLSAVERIEVLPDGSSALYGSDAIAGVVNIIMRDSLAGGETQARLGTARGGGDETAVSQLFGNHWDTGSWLFAYQYSERTALESKARAYSANADKRPYGGTDQRTYSSNPGNIVDPLTLLPILAIPAGQNGKTLTSQDLLAGVVNHHNQNQYQYLLPDKRTHSAFFTTSRKLGERFELFAEGHYSHRSIASTEYAYQQLLFVPETNPFFIDAYGDLPYVIVAYNFLDDLGPISNTGETDFYAATLGVKTQITDSWKAVLSGFTGKESMHWTGYNQADFDALNEALADPNPLTAFNPFGSGSHTNPETLDAIRRIQRERAASDIKVADLVVDGPVAELPAGTSKLAMGANYRRENLDRDVTHSLYSRSVAAIFAEVSLPVTSQLDFSLAARYESYSDFGDTFNPRIGLRWAPTKSLRFRSSWGSSFRAPTLIDLYDRSTDAAAVFPLADPHSASGFSNVLLQQGSNPDLHEETATTWTAGVDFAPPEVPGFSVSSTLYVIDYGERIWRFRPTVTLESLLVDEQWSPLVMRDPPQSEIDTICASPIFFGSPTDCVVNPPTVILDLRVRNLSITTVKGIDMELRQKLQTNYGDFRFGLNGSYLFSFDQAVSQTASAVDLAGVALNPPNLRFRGTAEWYRHGEEQPGLGAGLVMDYVSNFRDEVNLPVTRISSALMLDLQLSYRTAVSDSWLENMEFILNAANIFDQNPPFMNRVQGYDSANADPYGRVLSFFVQKNW